MPFVFIFAFLYVSAVLWQCVKHAMGTQHMESQPFALPIKLHCIKMTFKLVCLHRLNSVLELMCHLSTLLSCIHDVSHWILTSTYTAFKGHTGKRGTLSSLHFQCFSNVKIDDFFFFVHPAWSHTRYNFGDITLICSKEAR